MLSVEAQALIAGGTLSAIAAGAHLASVFLGAPAYRFMGAGERMARAVEAGKLKPTLIALHKGSESIFSRKSISAISILTQRKLDFHVRRIDQCIDSLTVTANTTKVTNGTHPPTLDL